MPKVVVRHDLPIASGIEGRRDDLRVVDANDDDTVGRELPDADVFVVNPANWQESYLSGLREGDWVQATSTGYDAFPLEDFRNRGVAFCNAAGNYGPQVSEHTFALAFALSRRIKTLVKRQHEKTWDRSIGLATSEWKGKRLTIIGLGTIGEEIAKRGKAFEMDVVGVKRHPEAYDGCLARDRVWTPDDLPMLLPDTDLLVGIVPLTGETHHLIDEAVFEALPDSAYVINVARGEVVDEAALVDALNAGEIAGAGLDVFETEPLPEESPLWTHENVILTPHIAGRSDSFIDRFARMFLENYDRWQNQESLKNEIVPGRASK